MTSDHFVMVTDVGSSRARQSIKELETYRRAVLAAAFPNARRQPEGRIPVIYVSKTEWSLHAGLLLGAFFDNFLFQPLIVMTGEDQFSNPMILQRSKPRRAMGGPSTVRRELFQYISNFYIPRQPVWLREGMADYFMTVSYDESKHRVGFGKPYWLDLKSAVLRDTFTVKQLIHNEVNRQDDGFYPSSWMLVFYLLHKEPDRFARYQRQLVVSKGTEAEIWQSAFGDLDLDKLTDAMRDFAANGTYLYTERPLPPPVIAHSERELSEADLYAYRVLLGSVVEEIDPTRHPSNLRAMQDNLREALSRDPTHALALSLQQFMLGTPVELDKALAVAAKHPDDWRAWMLVAKARERQGDASAARSALERAVQLAKSNPSVVNSLTKDALKPKLADGK